MSRDDPQMKIRLPAELKAHIEESAATNKRTMNAEIVARLAVSFAPATANPPNDSNALENLRVRMEAIEKLTPALDRLEGLAPMLQWTEKNKPLLALLEKIRPAQELAEQLRSGRGRRPTKKE